MNPKRYRWMLPLLFLPVYFWYSWPSMLYHVDLWRHWQTGMMPAEAIAKLERDGALYNAYVIGDIILRPHQYEPHNKVILENVHIDGDLNLQVERDPGNVLQPIPARCDTVEINRCRMHRLYLCDIEAKHVSIRQTQVSEEVNLIRLSFTHPACSWLLLDFKDSLPLVRVSSEAEAHAVRLRHPTVPIACAISEGAFVPPTAKE